jgi:hypothetical protein
MMLSGLKKSCHGMFLVSLNNRPTTRTTGTIHDHNGERTITRLAKVIASNFGRLPKFDVFFDSQ